MGNGTSIGRVRGLGSAGHGALHWLQIRLANIGNLVLLLISLALLPAYDYATVHAWASRPLTATALILLIVTTFTETRLGVQVMLEDYVHEEGNKLAVLTLLTLFVLAGVVFGIVSVLRVAVGGA
jgi:succinate dehydrogenase / fumarate reductase membrane anchor subunit